MNKNKLLVLSYGLFLGWLTSFLYNGPILEQLFGVSHIKTELLAVAYIITPALVLIVIGLTKVPIGVVRIVMNSALMVCTIGTLLVFYMAIVAEKGLILYIVTGVMGVSSVLYISGWGCHFVALLKPVSMVREMTYVIVIGYLVLYINHMAVKLEVLGLSFSLLVLLLIGAIATSFKLNKIHQLTKRDTSSPNQLPWFLVLLVSLLMFLLNIGGGVVSTVVLPGADDRYQYVHVISMIPYILALLFVIKKHKWLRSGYFLYYGALFTVVGFVFHMISPTLFLVGYLFIILGYLAIDIYIWSLVGEIGFAFKEPIRIFSFSMAANLLAVGFGTVIGNHLITMNTLEDTIVLGIAVVGIFTALLLMPYINGRITEHLEKALESRLDENIKSNSKEFLLEQLMESDESLQGLTNRELEVFSLMLEGHKNLQIAERMFISENTMKTHARNIYRKIGVKNKRELLQIYMDNEIET